MMGPTTPEELDMADVEQGAPKNTMSEAEVASTSAKEKMLNEIHAQCEPSTPQKLNIYGGEMAKSGSLGAIAGSMFAEIGTPIGFVFGLGMGAWDASDKIDGIRAQCVSEKLEGIIRKDLNSAR
jgi:hypothetical protein